MQTDFFKQSSRVDRVLWKCSRVDRQNHSFLRTMTTRMCIKPLRAGSGISCFFAYFSRSVTPLTTALVYLPHFHSCRCVNHDSSENLVWMQTFLKQITFEKPWVSVDMRIGGFWLITLINRLHLKSYANINIISWLQENRNTFVNIKLQIIHNQTMQLNYLFDHLYFTISNIS